jgi:hypothetical protein
MENVSISGAVMDKIVEGALGALLCSDGEDV